MHLNLQPPPPQSLTLYAAFDEHPLPSPPIQRALHSQEISSLEDTVAALQADFQKSLSDSTASQKNLQDNLVEAKHELLRVQEQLALTEKVPRMWPPTGPVHGS